MQILEPLFAFLVSVVESILICLTICHRIAVSIVVSAVFRFVLTTPLRPILLSRPYRRNHSISMSSVFSYHNGAYALGYFRRWKSTITSAERVKKEEF